MIGSGVYAAYICVMEQGPWARGRCVGDLAARREGCQDEVCEKRRIKRLRSLLRAGMGAEVDW